MRVWFKKPAVLLGLFSAVVVITAFVVLSLQVQSSKKVAPKIGSIVEAIYGVGTVVSKKNYTFRIGVTKTLATLNVEEGELVKKGQLLALMDDGIRVQSPIAGTVTSVPYYVGETVFPQSVIVKIEDLSSLYVEAALDQQGILRAKKGMKVVMSFESIRNKQFTGKVVTIFPQDNQFLVRIEPEDLPPEILPGMTADIAIEVARREKALLIPELGILDGQVLIEREGDVQKIQVEVGSMDGEWAEVVSNNIKESDLILIKKN